MRYTSRLLCITLLKGWLGKDLSMPKLKFLADEDVDARLIKSLSSKGIDIKYTEKGVRNSKLYSVACEESRAILTRDKDFLKTSLFQPSKLPAIVVMRVHPPAWSMLEPLVMQFLEKFSDDMKGKTWMITEEGFSLAD